MVSFLEAAEASEAIFLLDLVVKRLMKTISRDNIITTKRMHSFTLQQVQALTDQCVCIDPIVCT